MPISHEVPPIVNESTDSHLIELLNNVSELLTSLTESYQDIQKWNGLLQLLKEPESKHGDSPFAELRPQITASVKEMLEQAQQLHNSAKQNLDGILVQLKERGFQEIVDQTLAAIKPIERIPE